MSTPRKRTAAEAERVRLVNLLARLYHSAEIASMLQREEPSTHMMPFVRWLQRYTKESLESGLSRRNAGDQISLTALIATVKRLGATPKAGTRPTQIAEAVVATRHVVKNRRDSKNELNPFTANGKTDADIKKRYQEVAARRIVRAYAEIAGCRRLAYAYRECCWQYRVKFDETLDELAREDAARLDKVP